MTAPYAWHWNAPRPAIDPATFGSEQPTISPLAKLTARYALEEEKAAYAAEKEGPATLRTRLDTLIDKAESREEDRAAYLTKTAGARLKAKTDREGNQVAALLALPVYLRTPLLQRLRFLREKQRDAERTGKRTRPASRFLRDQLNHILKRIGRTDARFNTPQYQYIAARERLDALLDLPQLTKREVQTLATLTAGAVEGEFNRLCEQHGSDSSLIAALAVYQQLARMVFKLNITPPAWAALGMDGNRRAEPNLDLLPGAIARLTCATWWQHQLWRLRRVWREEQLRAAGQVSRTTSVYLSHDALIEHREQRRRMRDFLKSYEIVNEDGFTLDLEEAYYAGNSNPTHRRCEMMATMKGLELIAEARGDEAVFMTITCPSRFHATLENGQLNPKWDGSTVRDSSDYLVNVFFSGVRKKLNRKKLRWYGVRVAEPNHDGTVHWHMMMFTHPDDRETITDIVREFAIREDCAELSNGITPRFKSELITKEKGTPTAYIATYIGKGIDGAAAGGIDPKTGKPRIDNDSGKNIADSVEHVVGWASLHRVQQFRFFGIPSRQAYRELRRLAMQMSRKKDGPHELTDKAMDNVMVAADAGCFASYIMAQGGVLIPRKDHVVRTAYDVADKLNDYGEAGIQIFGVWSPALGEDSRVCTHPDNWELVRKQPHKVGDTPEQGVGFEFSLDSLGGPAAPWTRGNNCPPEQNSDNLEGESATHKEHENINIDALTFEQRRDMLKRMRLEPPVNAKKETPEEMPGNRIISAQSRAPQRPVNGASLTALLGKAGFDASAHNISIIQRGGCLTDGLGNTVRIRQGKPTIAYDGAHLSNTQRLELKRHVDTLLHRLKPARK
ncbi:replication endonuclease [Rahnella sp. ChDrAdgB13]|uniref:replication endonuclease n=1 Tax=Rahnella sp. ChDrAdgB13 TaxID=1850581 RepID=UPI001AD8602C|nr:replication endonuclease [Rahnella sp. ChDrAdgB13]